MGFRSRVPGAGGSVEHQRQPRQGGMSRCRYAASTVEGTQSVNAKRLIVLAAVLTLAIAACGGASSGGETETTDAPVLEAGDPIAGIDVYKSSCRNCHGSDLQGISGLGRPLAPNAFVAVRTEDELAAFIAVGRPLDHPDNTQAVPMPPKGGNASLNAQDLLDVAAYLKAQN
jgi:mono/diheme cytochrome c family protein